MNIPSTIEKWDCFELRIQGPSTGNPFTDVTISAVFKYNHLEIVANGFYDGDGQYCVRFMPDVVGVWTFETTSNVEELNGVVGEFSCIEPSVHNHGPVKVSQTYHFAYEDQTPYYPVGTTCYVWTHQSEELQLKTLESLKNSPFNKIRMCVFPKHYDYNLKEPNHLPFQGSLQEGIDFSRFNPTYWQQLERRIIDLQDAGIECDLIIFHPYDRWGFSTMESSTDDFYLSYLLARLSAYRNIWWSLANEFDLLSKPMEDWDRFFRIIQQNDPHQHLRSIHNFHNPNIHYRSNLHWYDHGKPWATHASIQHHDLLFVKEWRELYQKPIVVDECRYEGNIKHGWGNITAEEMVACFWHGMIRGGYVSHGETFNHPDDIIWWSHGGELHGESADRIQFLRDVMAQGPVLNTPQVSFDWDASIGGVDGEYYLVYFGTSRPACRVLVLPENMNFTVEVIDTWEMKITKLDGVYQNGIQIDLPGKPYQALRIKKSIEE